MANGCSLRRPGVPLGTETPEELELKTRLYYSNHVFATFATFCHVFATFFATLLPRFCHAYTMFLPRFLPRFLQRFLPRFLPRFAIFLTFRKPLYQN
jgi:hypothetical protein